MALQFDKIKEFLIEVNKNKQNLSADYNDCLKIQD